MGTEAIEKKSVYVECGALGQWGTKTVLSFFSFFWPSVFSISSTLPQCDIVWSR